MPDIKPNFFTGSAVPKQEMLQIVVMNDVKFRAGYYDWLYKNFDLLVDEYDEHGRFLSLQELQDSPLD